MRFIMPPAPRALGLLTLSLFGVSLAMAQSGPKDMISLPLYDVEAKLIRLQSKEGKLYPFVLNSRTVFCKGEHKVWDWSYLSHEGKGAMVSLKLSPDSKNALVVWNQAPVAVPSTGASTPDSPAFDFPPMCK